MVTVNNDVVFRRVRREAAQGVKLLFTIAGLLFRFPVGVRIRPIAISVSVCLFVCLSVCPLAYLKNHMSKFHKIFYTRYV